MGISDVLSPGLNSSRHHSISAASSRNAIHASGATMLASNDKHGGPMFSSKIGSIQEYKLDLTDDLNNGVYSANGFDELDKRRPDHSDAPPTADPNGHNLLAPKPVPFFSVFRFASLQDRVLILMGVLAAMLGGVTLPVMIVLFGDLTNAFVVNAIDLSKVCSFLPSCCDNDTFAFELPTCNVTLEGLQDMFPNLDFFAEVAKFGLGTVVIGAINMVMAYAFVTCLNHAAECQVHKIRALFLKSILRQEIGWYDTHQTSDFAAKMTEDLNKLQEGIGEKVGMFIFFMTIFLASMINAFIHGWELTLVILAAMPILSVSLGIIARSQAALTEKELAAYGKAAAIAEEVLSAIKTVVAFGGQNHEVKRYESRLVHARKAGIIRGMLTGVGGCSLWFIVYSSYALAFWYGVKLIMDDREACVADFNNCYIRYDPSSLLIVFLSVLMGAINVGQAAPYVEAFSMAKAAAAAIFAIIDRQSLIDPLSEEGEKPKSLSRDILFENVYFNYPSRPNVKVLQGLNLKVRKGETVALVGASGCGKSTVIQLVQRFYDPDFGCIKLGSNDIRTLNISWLRERIGVVGQEPVLFGCTIAENIRYGKENISDEEMDRACKQANAYDFIQKLPMKYHTLVGERGAKLSGGQKQRIAIARALVRNPEILLLDEATSALDTHSEAIVQKALDQARSGRTTIVVAHRLSTIRTADTIVALKDGRVAEIGNHEELMKQQGLYYSLVMAQSFQEDSDKSDHEEEEEEEADTLSMPLSSLMSTVSCNYESLRSNGLSRNVSRKISISSINSDHSIDLKEDTIGKTLSSSLMRMNSLPGRFLPHSLSHSLQAEASNAEQKENEEDDGEPPTKPTFMRILRTNRPEAVYLFFGAVASVVMGASMPVYAILFGEVLGVLSEPVEEARAHSIFYSILFMVTGVVVGLAMLVQMAMFSIAGERLTLRMRKMAFEAMLRQEMAWFDLPQNNTGALCSRLSADASAIQGATGSRFGAMMQSVFSIVLAIGSGIYHEWKLGLVGAAFVPFVLAASVVHMKIMSSQDSVERKSLINASKMAVDAIANIRTVAGLGLEKTFVQSYVTELVAPHSAAPKKSHLRGLVFGFAQAMPFFAYSGTMYYGGYLVREEGLPYESVFKVAEALILGTIIVGQATAFAPNYSKAMVAASRVFKLLDRRPTIDGHGQSGIRLNKMNGHIEFKDVQFSYPTRPQVKVLQSLNMSLEPGQKIALVGASGCGKSTCIQLLQRFYNLDGGDLTVDSHHVDALNVPWTRSRMGIVSQEPILFDCSLADNIRYGDNERNASMDEVVEAAKRANIHHFIASLPQGYATRVGDKGAQLSGGQKQRVAIARALIRDPDILLLDEATSALDTESEKVVQEALDEAQRGRTSITIAHRLSTVQHMDKIFVMSKGRVAESGTHAQLVAAGGIYYRLWSRQMGVKH